MVLELVLRPPLIMAVNNAEPFLARYAQQLREQVGVIVGGPRPDERGGEAGQRIAPFAEVHAEDRPLNEREAYPMVNVPHMEGTMLEEDDVGPALGLLLDQAEEVER